MNQLKLMNLGNEIENFKNLSSILNSVSEQGVYYSTWPYNTLKNSL